MSDLPIPAMLKDADRAWKFYELTAVRETYGLGSLPNMIGDLACHVMALAAEVARLESDLSGLRSLVIQPWTREGDGAELFKINLAWWDTAPSREDAEVMVRNAIERHRERERTVKI